MTPTKSITSEITQIPTMHLDVKQASTFELEVEESSDFLCIGNSLKQQLKLNVSSNSYDSDRTIETCEAINSNTSDKTSIVTSNSLTSVSCQDDYSLSNTIVDSKVPIFCDGTLKTYSIFQHSEYRRKTLLELKNYSLKELHQLIDDFTITVEAVSSELVQLLLENDSLQQESDARNVAIEQLLKMTVKNTENELRPIQMSVILPSNESDDDDDDVDDNDVNES